MNARRIARIRALNANATKTEMKDPTLFTSAFILLIIAGVVFLLHKFL